MTRIARFVWGGALVLGAASAMGPALLSNLPRPSWQHEAPRVSLSDPERVSAEPTPLPSPEAAPAAAAIEPREVHLVGTTTDPDDTRAAVGDAGGLWVATGGGLLRVDLRDDGPRSRWWTSADGLPDHRLTAIARTEDGRLVAGTEGGGVMLLDPDAVADGGGPRVLAWAEAAPARISDLLTEDGAIYAATWGAGVFVARAEDPLVFRPLGPDTGLRARQVTSLARAGDELLAGTAGAGVWVRADDGRTRRYVARGGLAGDFVLDLHEEGGAVWAATPGGLSRYRRGAWSTWRGGDRVPTGVLRALGEDPEGRLALAASGGRVGRFGASDAEHLPESPDAGPRPGLPGIEARWLAAGAGFLFAGTDRGLLRRTEHGWVPLVHAGPGSNDVTAVAARDGSLLVGTFDRGAAVRRGDPGRWDPLALPDGEVNGVHLDADGTAWVGSARGLTRAGADGSLRRWTRAQGLASDHVAAVRAFEGGLWLGTSAGVQRHDGIGLGGAGAGELDGLHHVYDLAPTAGGVWVGTLDGLWELGEGRAVHHRYESGELPDNWVNAVVVGPDGTVWAGTYDQGVALRRPGGDWAHLREGDDLPCGWVNPGAMAALPDGTVLVGTLGGGLLRLSTGGLVDRWTMRDGLAGDDVTSVAVDGDRVWVGTRSGLSEMEVSDGGPRS